MKNELEKLAAEMQKMKPSKTSRSSGMDAAMAAFNTEFAADSEAVNSAEKITAPENKLQNSQGLEDAARPTGQTIGTKPMDTFRSDVMSKIKSVFSFDMKTKMMMGSCAAALMFAAVIVPNSRPGFLETPPMDAVSGSVEAIEPLEIEGPKIETPAPNPVSPARPEVHDEIIVTGRSAPEPSPTTAAEADSNSAITSAGELLNKVRKDTTRTASENKKRERRFEAPRGAGQSALQTPPAPQIERQQALQGKTSQFSQGYVKAAPPPPVISRMSRGKGVKASSIASMSRIQSGITTDALEQTTAIAGTPKTKTITRRIIKTPARTVERSVPAITKQETRRVQKPDGRYETVTETIVVQEASTELVKIPATFETISETVIVQPDQSEFEKFTPNPVIAVTDTPVSTFSVDVDTASYSFFRSAVNRGQLPPPSSVRVEEMINYFSYDYDAPRSADEPFKANVTVTPTPWNADTKLMRIGIKGYVPAVAERPSSNIVFLIDTSGSMSQPNKLPLLINSFKLLLNTLDEDDTVSIVTYAGSAGTVLEPTSASDKNKINAALGNLRAGGSTAGAAGLELAYNKAAESFDKDGVNRVILATDGDFNVGFSSPDEMKTFITEKRKTGIFLSVLGFGNGNYKDDLMQSLAQNGNGTAAYIDTLAEANKVLADASGGALITIAKDVKIQVEFNPDTIAEYRLIGYETRALKRQDFNNDAVDAGEIGAGHSVTALYELTPVGSPARVIDDLRYVKEDAKPKSTGSKELAFVKIRHKLPNADTSTLQTFPVEPRQQRSIKRASDDIRFAAAVAAAGQKLRGDTQLANYSYDDIITLAKSGKGDDDNGYRAEFIQLLRLVETIDDTDAVQVDPRRRR